MQFFREKILKEEKARLVWEAERETGKDTRKELMNAFNKLICPFYDYYPGALTNDIYYAIFGKSANELKIDLK